MRLFDIGIAVLPSSETRLAAFWGWLKWAAAAIGAAAFGAGPRELLGLYLTFVLIDFVTGVLASGLVRKVSSKIAFRGILKKLMGLAAIAFAHAVDLFLATSQQGAPGMVQGIVTRLLIGYEFLSIAENLAAAGIVLPKGVTDLITRITTPATAPGTKVTVDTIETTTRATVETHTPHGVETESVTAAVSPMAAVPDAKE